MINQTAQYVYDNYPDHPSLEPMRQGHPVADRVIALQIGQMATLLRNLSALAMVNGPQSEVFRAGVAAATIQMLHFAGRHQIDLDEDFAEALRLLAAARN